MAMGTWRESKVENRKLQNAWVTKYLEATPGTYLTPSGEIGDESTGILVTESDKWKYRQGTVKSAQTIKEAGGVPSVELPGSTAIDPKTGEPLKETDYTPKEIPYTEFNHSRTRSYTNRGGVLRYPYEALTEKTDYLQIDIVEYQPASKSSGNQSNLIGRPGTRRIPLRSRVSGGVSTQSLVNKGTVLLQIPSQVQDGNSVNYGDSEMNTIVGAALQASQKAPQALAKGIAGAFKGGGMESVMGGFSDAKTALSNALESSQLTMGSAQNLLNKKIATSIVGAFGGNVTVNQLLARQEGQVFNPNMELLFNGPTLRNFRFSFKMTPRSQQEAEQCKLIIRSFKMNMAPKVTAGRGTQSLFLNTPNVFELRYKSGYRNHPFLHKFKQCFLTDVSVNYTGEGVYATYENREPVSMIMDLSFKELEPIYDLDYFNDRGRDLDSTVGF